MIANQLPLIRRELWEHRAIYGTPLVIGFLICLLAITGQATITANGKPLLDLALIGASVLHEQERAAIITSTMIGISSLLALAMCVLAVFYCLDALYAERKDRSILFWRSMPVTDAETVLSKLLTVLFVIPLTTFAVAIVTQLAVLASASVWISARGAHATELIWSAAPFGQLWFATLAYFIAVPLWLAPYAGWFLFVSAFTRRSALLVAFLPILVLPMLEKTLLGTSVLARAFFTRVIELPLFRGFDPHALVSSGRPYSLDLLSLLDFTAFLTSPGLWLGLAVCALFATGAIWLRRYRDDS